MVADAQDSPATLSVCWSVQELVPVEQRERLRLRSFNYFRRADVVPRLQGSRPLIFLCKHRAAGVRIAYIPEGGKQSQLKQGLQLRADRKVPIVGLAAHPSRELPLRNLLFCS